MPISDNRKTKKELLAELQTARQRIAELDKFALLYQAGQRMVQERTTKLTESEDKWRALVERAPEGIQLVDEQGLVVEWNPGNEQITGLTREEVLGRPVWEVITQLMPAENKNPMALAKLHAEMTEFFEADHLDKSHYIWHETAPIHIQRPDGSRRMIQTLVFPIKLANGSMSGAISRDVTVSQHMEHALRESAEMFASVVEQSYDGIWLIDEQGTVTEWNPGNEQIMGLKQSEVLGWPLWRVLYSMMPPERKSLETYRQLKKNIMGFLKTGQSDWLDQFLTAEIQRPDGTRRAIHTLIFPLKMEQSTMGCGICRDVTEQKLMENQLRQAHDRLEQRVIERTAELSLTNDLLQQRQRQLRDLTARLSELEEAERRKFARELHDQVGQTLSAININLSIIQSQLSRNTKLLIKKRLTDSMELVRQVTKRVQDVMADLRSPVLDDYGLLAALKWYGVQFASRMNIKVMVHGMEPMPRLNMAVENALFRIAQEALTNVAKHAQAKQITIIMETNPQITRLTIADDGVGFNLADNNIPEKRQSWGMISMTERAEAVGGIFRIASQPGLGTEVMVVVNH